VNSGGVPQAGPYVLDAWFQAAPGGDCSVTAMDVQMVWASCSAQVADCFEAPDSNGVTRRWLRTPTTGRVAKEAHLVTVDDGFGSGWPTSFTDGIEAHHARSQQASGYVMSRTEPWAPAGEGGSRYGQGSTGNKVPVLDEAWYVNMYWRVKPAPGTRMIVRNPATGRAAVAAAGWETGPGDITYIGGAAEEIHHHLGTSHGGTLEFGFAANASLPLGPITCPP
jgi:hypothetical protein